VRPLSTRIQSSFRAGLDRLRTRRARAAGQAAHQRDEQLTRERYRFLQGDAAFLLSGEVEGAADGEDGEDSEDGVLEARIAGRSELWWAIQVTRAFERSKVSKRCKIKCFWMDSLGNRRFRLLTDREVSVFFGTILCDPSTKEPICIHADDLPPTWDEELDVVASRRDPPPFT
jgi:hypothetical protein